MLTNFTSTYNDSALHPNNSLGIFMFEYLHCLSSTKGLVIITLFSVVTMSIHPALSIFILHHGLQLYRKNPSAFLRTASHSDFFTYHLAAMELIGAFGIVLSCFCLQIKATGAAIQVGVVMNSIAWYGEMFFHILTCMERYLAVNHPIAYISLRSQRGTRIRNICISCVWLLCLAGIYVTLSNIFVIINFCLVIVSVSVVFFCSLSVLSALIRPGPGNQSTGREKGDQSKRRAFYTILSILGVLVLRFIWGLCWAIMFVEGNINCVMMTIDVWINLPSSVVLQFLFLHRLGKLMCRNKCPMGIKAEAKKLNR